MQDKMIQKNKSPVNILCARKKVLLMLKKLYFLKLLLYEWEFMTG